MLDLMTLARENGFSHWADLCMSALIPLAQIRDMCAADRCGQWGKNWACPPGCGSLEQCTARLRAYDSGILVQSTVQLSDPFDYDGMTAAARAHRRRFASFARQVGLLCPNCLPLSAGACTVCSHCTCPARPCRFPGKRISSMEAYGLFVSNVCTLSGLSYNYGENTLTYTSCVLYNKD